MAYSDELRTWMDEFELEWEHGGMEKHAKNAHATFESMMTGLASHNHQRQPAPSALTSTHTRADACSRHSAHGTQLHADGTACKESGCWFDNQSKTCLPEKDCFVGRTKMYCENELRCHWDPICNVCWQYLNETKQQQNE